MLIELAILILAIPVGYLIAYLTKDELVSGRIWFFWLIVLSAIGAIVFYFLKNEAISLTFLFIIIIATISLIKSNDKKFVKRRI